MAEAKLKPLIAGYRDALDEHIKKFEDFVEDNNNLPASEPENRDTRDKALTVLRDTQKVKESLLALDEKIGDDQ